MQDLDDYSEDFSALVEHGLDVEGDYIFLELDLEYMCAGAN